MQLSRLPIALVLLLLSLSLAAPAPRLLAQTPPDDEIHAQVRKEIAEAQERPDPREDKGSADKPKNRADDDNDDNDDKRTARRAEKAQRDDSQNKSDDQKGADKKTADKKDEGKKEETKKDDQTKDEPKPVVTHGKVTIDGKKVAYRATAGKMLMKTDEGDPKAHVFFIAYTKVDRAGDDVSKNDRHGDRDGEKSDRLAPAPASRPITFCFNGGPGSSSVWLHIGMLGPVRVRLDSDAGTLPPPHELIPNEYSLLDVTDLVFIDPVSTGFSRPAKGEDRKQFHGYDEDLRSVAQFIHDYATKYGRWNSPKFLLGESYGGLRAAGLSGELQQRYHMYLNGIVLVSAVVDFQTLMFGPNNDVAYALFLPSYATTAWYHKALPESLQESSLEEVQKAAERFALGPYLRALAAGDSLDADRRAEVVARMAELTGLSKEYVERSNLRVPMYRFGKELLRKRGLIVGRFDSRYASPALDRVGDSTEYDPSASAVFGTFTSALNDYLRRTLKVEEDRVYEILTDRVQPWDYSEFANRFVNASGTLREAMTENPYLRVFAACGYYDLATPLVAMKHTRDHLNLSPALRDHFTMAYYEGGHMMYAHEPSLKKLREDLVDFYRESLQSPQAAKDDGDEN